VTSAETTTTAPPIDWAAPFDALVEGATFTTRGRTVTEADVVGFAALTGDWHPLHTDAVWAQDGPFGERIAHGLLVVSAAAGMVPFDPRRVMALRGLKDVTFKRPVPLGATISVQGSVRSLRPVGPDAGLVALQWSVIDEHGRLACRATVEVLWSSDEEETE
jgi:3-hydroxybutyryl-CoA dehydratase